MHEHDFTAYTIRQYRRIFPKATIILSTWKGESGLSRFDDLCEVVLSDASRVPQGYGNLQMHSSHEGVRKAERIGAKYVLKTRSDQRFGNNFLLQSLLSFHSYFPLANTSNQVGRLITFSLDTFLYRVYGVSDMMTFGRIEDVRNFWSGDYLDPVNNRAQPYPEVQYCVNFLHRIGESIEWTTEHYLKVLRERFLVLDASALGLSWPKYQSLENRWSGDRGLAHLEQISFDKWLANKSHSLCVDPEMATET